MAPKRRRPWRRSTLSWEIPITRFQFSSGCCRYLLALRLLRRCCESIRSGIRSVTILVFKDWRQKRSCEFKKIPRPNLARVLSAGNFAVRVSRWRRLLIQRWTHSTCAQGRLLNVFFCEIEQRIAHRWSWLNRESGFERADAGARG